MLDRRDDPEDVSLFRPEAVEARRGEWLGSINLATSKTQKLLGAAAIVFFATACLLLIFGQYSRRMSLSGVLLESQLSTGIEVKQASYLCTLLVQEGQRVEEGAPLAQTSLDPCEGDDVELRETIRAPKAGFVVGISKLVAPARLVAGQKLLSVNRPSGSLVAVLDAPDQIVGYVETGDSVAVRVDALPSQKFGTATGRVMRIEPVDATPDRTDVLPGYKLEATLDKAQLRFQGRDIPLQSGMRINSSVVLETRRLYEWIFEPLYLRRQALASEGART